MERQVRGVKSAIRRGKQCFQNRREYAGGSARARSSGNSQGLHQTTTKNGHSWRHFVLCDHPNEGSSPRIHRTMHSRQVNAQHGSACRTAHGNMAT